jgi:transposase
MGASLSGRELCSRKKGGSGIGKTKVGKGSKVMLVVDGNGLPIGLHLASAQPHEITLAAQTLKTIRVPQKRGRPRTRPQALAADKAYDSRPFRAELRQRGIQVAIPTFERRKRKQPKRGRPIQAGPLYQSRWKVERSFAWMDNCRRLVVRWERSLHIYKAFCLVALILWSVNRILK